MIAHVDAWSLECAKLFASSPHPHRRTCSATPWVTRQTSLFGHNGTHGDSGGCPRSAIAATSAFRSATPSATAFVGALGERFDHRLLFGGIKVAVAILVDLGKALLHAVAHLVFGEESVAIRVLLFVALGDLRGHLGDAFLACFCHAGQTFLPELLGGLNHRGPIRIGGCRLDGRWRLDRSWRRRWIRLAGGNLGDSGFIRRLRPLR